MGQLVPVRVCARSPLASWTAGGRGKGGFFFRSFFVLFGRTRLEGCGWRAGAWYGRETQGRAPRGVFVPRAG